MIELYLVGIVSGIVVVACLYIRKQMLKGTEKVTK